jgi:hypothetical protein
MSLGNNSGDATLSGTLTKASVHGVASFSNLTLNQPGSYTLTAASAAASSATSTSFNVGQTVTVDCPAGGCTNTLSTPFSSAQVQVGSGAGDASLTQSVDVGTPLDGPGSPPDNVGCAAYSPPPGSVDFYGILVSDSNRAKTITWDVNDARNGIIPFLVCFGAPYDFQTGLGYNGEPIFAPPGTLPDGSPGFVGLLDSCSDLVDAASSNPCVSSLVPFGDFGAQVTITIPAGLAGDPFMGR